VLRRRLAADPAAKRPTASCGVRTSAQPAGASRTAQARARIAALSGRLATVGAVFPSLLQAASTPWVSYPGLYTARCEHSDGASDRANGVQLALRRGAAI
jgi:hypothetical protein